MKKCLFIAISFYLNIVCKNIVCELGLNLNEIFLTVFFIKEFINFLHNKSLLWPYTGKQLQAFRFIWKVYQSKRLSVQQYEFIFYSGQAALKFRFVSYGKQEKDYFKIKYPKNKTNIYTSSESPSHSNLQLRIEKGQLHRWWLVGGRQNIPGLQGR